jgi:hypothetical protein
MEIILSFSLEKAIEQGTSWSYPEILKIGLDSFLFVLVNFLIDLGFSS